MVTQEGLGVQIGLFFKGDSGGVPGTKRPPVNLVFTDLGQFY